MHTLLLILSLNPSVIPCSGSPQTNNTFVLTIPNSIDLFQPPFSLACSRPFFPFTCYSIPPPVTTKKIQYTAVNNSASSMNLPSLYFSVASYALSYFHPTVSLHCRQLISRTRWRPVVMLRSTASVCVMFTTEAKR